MNPAPNTTTADNGGNFDPQQAAALLDQTTLRARRQLEPFPPWLLVLRGLGALVVYGAIWLTVRDQHPYSYPTAWAIPAGVAFGVANTVATVAVARHATAGVVGRSRLRASEVAAWVALWLAVFAVMAAFGAAGVSDRITYGLYPACVPLIVAGLGWAAVMARQSGWRRSGTALAIAVAGGVAWLAGPAGAWLVAGAGICVVLLGSAAVVARRQHA
jgi:hypothetical protein